MATDSIRVLLVDGTEPDVSGIAGILQDSISPSFVFHHFDRPWPAIRFLQERNVDVVVLAFEILEYTDAGKIFRVLGETADAPVILFTGEEDAALKTLKEDAAANITRAHFAASPETLLDTIKAALEKDRQARAAAAVRAQEAPETKPQA